MNLVMKNLSLKGAFKWKKEFKGVVKSAHVAGAMKIFLSLKNLRTRDEAFFVFCFFLNSQIFLLLLGFQGGERRKAAV